MTQPTLTPVRKLNSPPAGPRPQPLDALMWRLPLRWHKQHRPPTLRELKTLCFTPSERELLDALGFEALDSLKALAMRMLWRGWALDDALRWLVLMHATQDAKGLLRVCAPHHEGLNVLRLSARPTPSLAERIGELQAGGGVIVWMACHGDEHQLWLERGLLAPILEALGAASFDALLPSEVARYDRHGGFLLSARAQDVGSWALWHMPRLHLSI